MVKSHIRRAYIITLQRPYLEDISSIKKQNRGLAHVCCYSPEYDNIMERGRDKIVSHNIKLLNICKFMIIEIFFLGRRLNKET